MSYTEESVTARLSGLNETQDSIVSVAQWIMFHRRHADRTASLWFNRLQESPSTNKRLNLIYLANEVVQQSRARAKKEFLIAFEPLIADATALAYKGANQDVQGKLRRVVEVWRQRQIFDPRIQEQTEKRLEELDKQRGVKSIGGSGGRLGGSLFGSTGGLSSEVEEVSKKVATVHQAETSAKASIQTADGEFEKQLGPDAPLPSAPMRAARLRGLAKNFMSAQNAVSKSVQARQELLVSLEKLIETHRIKLTEDESMASNLATKLDTIESTIKDVEDSIMRGQDTPTPTANGHSNSTGFDPERPEPEGFTPPPTTGEDVDELQLGDSNLQEPESLADDGTVLEPKYTDSNTNETERTDGLPVANDELQPLDPLPVAEQLDPAAAAKEFLESLNLPAVRSAPLTASPTVSMTDQNVLDPRAKRRKLGHKPSDMGGEEIFGADDLGDMDEDGISAMLNR